MFRRLFFVATLAAPLMAAGCINPVTNYHGYFADEAEPVDMEPGIDTRSSVLARLGSPSTESVFDDNTWYYITTQREQFAFYIPEVSERRIIGIRFSDDDVVEEVLEYDLEDSRLINYASRETPTLGRQLTFLEQLLGSVGNVALPNTDEITPDNPTGRR